MQAIGPHRFINHHADGITQDGDGVDSCGDTFQPLGCQAQPVQHGAGQSSLLSGLNVELIGRQNLVGVGAQF